jgi:hypothetical protein
VLAWIEVPGWVEAVPLGHGDGEFDVVYRVVEVTETGEDATGVVGRL